MIVVRLQVVTSLCMHDMHACQHMQSVSLGLGLLVVHVLCCMQAERPVIGAQALRKGDRQPTQQTILIWHVKTRHIANLCAI